MCVFCLSSYGCTQACVCCDDPVCVCLPQEQASWLVLSCKWLGQNSHFSTHFVSHKFCLPSTANSGQHSSDHRLPSLQESLLWCYIQTRMDGGEIWEHEQGCQTLVALDLEGMRQLLGQLYFHTSFFPLSVWKFPQPMIQLSLSQLVLNLSKRAVKDFDFQCELKLWAEVRVQISPFVFTDCIL